MHACMISGHDSTDDIDCLSGITGPTVHRWKGETLPKEECVGTGSATGVLRLESKSERPKLCSQIEAGGFIKIITTALSCLIMCWKLSDALVKVLLRRCSSGSSACCLFRTFGRTVISIFSIWVGAAGLILIMLSAMASAQVDQCVAERNNSMMSIGFTCGEILALILGWLLPADTEGEGEREEEEEEERANDELGAVESGSGAREGAGAADEGAGVADEGTIEKAQRCKGYYNLIQGFFATLVDFADTGADVVRFGENACANFSGNVPAWILANLIVGAVRAHFPFSDLRLDD